MSGQPRKSVPVLCGRDLRKIGGKNKLLKTTDCAKTKREEELLLLIAKNEIEKIEAPQRLFI